MLQTDAKMHPTIKRCLKHLDILGTDDKTRQIVYMYMETLVQEIAVSKQVNDSYTTADSDENDKKRI
jgi:hypothetical protein